MNLYKLYFLLQLQYNNLILSVCDYLKSKKKIINDSNKIR